MEEEQPAPVYNATKAFQEKRLTLALNVFERTQPAITTAKELTRCTDSWIRTLWQEACQGTALGAHTLLFAQGGYGRHELSFASDLDVLIEVHDDAAIDTKETIQVIERWMTWVRQGPVKLSHSVRTKSQGATAMRTDPRTALSLLDARLIDGDESLCFCSNTSAHVLKYLSNKEHQGPFLRWLVSELHARHERLGSTVYLLEPDIKSGVGGLRDLHYLRWCGLVRWNFDPASELCDDAQWSALEHTHFQEDLEWLLGLRHELHLRHGRKQDRLRFPDQEALVHHALMPAHKKDEKREEHTQAHTERFLHTHYIHSRRVHRTARLFLRAWVQDTLQHVQPLNLDFARAGHLMTRICTNHAQLSTDAIFDALELMQDQNLEPSPSLEAEIREHIAMWKETSMCNASITPRFLSMLISPHTSQELMQALLELGILTHFIPEFQPLVCHVQHDVFHVYTTDVHTLKCVGLARKLVGQEPDPQLNRWPIFRHVARSIKRKDVLFLACLLHDIGKNRGGGHSQRGAAMMPAIAQRLGLDKETCALLEFLILEHLCLSQTARRRDTSDPHVVEELAARIGSTEKLNLLTSLTFCDSSTVSPEGISDWIAALIIGLHHRIHDTLHKRVDTLDFHTQLRAKLAALAHENHHQGTHISWSLIEEFLTQLPTAHLRSFKAQALHRQLRAFAAHEVSALASVVHTEVLDHLGITEVIVLTPNSDTRLEQLAGALSAKGFEIMTAEVTTTTKEMLLGIFRITQPTTSFSPVPGPSTLAPNEKRLKRLRKCIANVLSGEERVLELIAQRLNEQKLAPPQGPRVDVHIKEIVGASESWTVLEVRAPDRLGLLYDIACTLRMHQIKTHFSKLDSLGNVVVDTFYISTTDNAHLNAFQLKMLEDALIERITTSPFGRTLHVYATT